MPKRICALAIFLCLIFLDGHSQIMNIERFRLDKDTFNVWLGNAGLGFSSVKQQNNVREYSASLNLVYLSSKHSYMTINNFKLQQINKIDFISQGYTHWRANFFRRKRVSYEPFTQFQYDLGRGLTYRNLYGISFRLNLLHLNKKNDKAEIALGTGAMYEHEKWRGAVLRFALVEDSTRANTIFAKSVSTFFTRLALHQKITLFSAIYYQTRFDNLTFYRIISDIQLQFKITKALSLSNQFVSTYDSKPIVEGNIFTYTLSGNLIFNLK